MLGWADGTGAPTWRKLSASWTNAASGAAKTTSLQDCSLVSGAESCTATAAPSLKLTLSGRTATLMGLPGIADTVSLQQAGPQLTPVLSSPAF